MTEFEKLPAITPAPISLVMPAFNSAATYESEIGAWSNMLREIGNGFEIIVVNDASTDRTRPLSEELTARFPDLRVIHQETHRGFGASLRTGISAARHPLLAYVEMGRGYRPADIKGMLKWIDEVYLVAGHRISAERPNRKFRSRWLHRRVAHTIFGVHMRDLGCLFLLARRAIFKRIPIQSNGPFAHAEVLAKANFQGCLMTEVPVRCTEASMKRRAEGADSASIRAEALRLFRDPDFGPVSVSD